MKLLLPAPIVERLKRKLRGRIREIGGIIVGEHAGQEVFRVVDISFQKRGGTIAHFVRDPAHHRAFLDAFFQRTGHDYTRFNYLGEWHSHPAFEPLPSGEDLRTMYDLVQDQAVGVNFAVLIIARLTPVETLEFSATLFRAGVVPESIGVEVERVQGSVVKRGWIGRFFGTWVK